jgi:predicted acylesterase/phospholipase RssA/CRP-like cAMP-binding protein
MRYEEANPEDELVQYPHPDRIDSASLTSSADSVLAEDGVFELTASPAGDACPRNQHRPSVSSGVFKDVIATDSETAALHAAMGPHAGRVLAMVGHMFQLTQSAAISLGQKSKELQLQPGETLFSARDDAVDGVFLVLAGSLLTCGDQRGAAYVVDDCLLAAGELAEEWGGAGSTPPHLPFTPGMGYGFDTALYGQGSMGGLTSPTGDAHSNARRQALPPVLCEFDTGSTIGENSLLEGNHSTRAVTAQAGCYGASLVKIDRSTYQWFVSQWPRSTLNFILSTTARQYRVAFFALVDFLGLPQAAFAAQESHPEPRVCLLAEGGKGKAGTQPLEIAALRTAAASMCHLKAGETLFREGDASDCLYVLVDGCANAFVQCTDDEDDAASHRGSGSVAAHSVSGPPEAESSGAATPAFAPDDTLWVGELLHGSIAGGISCFVNIPRRATVVCSTACSWAVLSRRQFLSAARQSESGSAAASGTPHVLAVIAQQVAKALTPLLRMFLGLGLQRVWLSAGDTLYSAGDDSDGMYLVISGRLRINLQPTGRGGGATEVDKQASMHVTRGGMHTTDDAGTAALALAMGQPLSRVDVTRGESVGEVAVLRRSPSSATPQREHTVQCVRDCELVRISPAAFDWIATAHPDIMRQFAVTMAHRYSSLLGRMHGTGGGGVPGGAPSISHELQAALRHREQRSRPQHDGAGRLQRSSSMGRVTHAVSIAGLTLMSSLTRATAAGTARDTHANRPKHGLPGDDSVVSHSTKSDISTICVLPAGATPPSHAAIAHFVADLAGSLRAHGDVRVVDASVLDEEFGAGTAHGVGASSIFTRARISAWLCSQEERHRFTIMVCDVAMPHWCTTAYSQADLALLVAEAGSDPTPHPVEQMLSEVAGNKRRTAPHTDALRSVAHSRRPHGAMNRLASSLGLADAASGALQSMGYLQSLVAPGADTHIASATHSVGEGTHMQSGRSKLASFARRELVLLHASSKAPPKNTRAWLRTRTLSWHHHVRLDHAGDDVARVARVVAGAALGVVLGGGGARGLAHLGLLKSMEEKGIPVDFVGGTSQGAFVGGCYALTMSASKAGEHAKLLGEAIGTPLLVLRMTLPIMSYFSGALFNDVLQTVFRETQIEDLWVKYFCVSTNVTRDTMDVHQVGPVWRYARASMTVMGLLPPIMDVNGDLLVDGGYTNNMPVDCMYAMCPSINTVVACDVENKDNSALENVDPEEYGDSVSGWYLLARILTSAVGIGKPLTIPSLSVITLKMSYISHTMAMRSMIARLRQAAAQGDTHVPKFVYVRPDVQSYSLLQYSKFNEIVNHGYLEAQNILRDFLSPAAPQLPPARGMMAVSGMSRQRSGSGSHLVVHPVGGHRRAASHTHFTQGGNTFSAQSAVSDASDVDGAPTIDEPDS